MVTYFHCSLRDHSFLLYAVKDSKNYRKYHVQTRPEKTIRLSLSHKYTATKISVIYTPDSSLFKSNQILKISGDPTAIIASRKNAPISCDFGNSPPKRAIGNHKIVVKFCLI